ncbi:MAG: hybrid sensor histidine kinase/response regulator, partial [Planctomycetes bacterium]|nr:hybrid sensor histidine kinase/response regulator [Planctomycetota bacterium]
MNHAHIRVLLLEDNPGDADRVSLALKKANGNYVVEWATRLSDAVQQLEERDFDVVLADLTLPDCHGLQAVTRLRDEVPDMPVVVLTSISNDKVAIESLSQGAQDYLVKDDFTADTLERSIRYAIHRGQLRSQTEALLEEVQQSKKLLEKKNRHLARLYKMAQRFVDNVSHEFRTPLTVIKEYAALMRERIVGPTNDEQDRMLAVVEDRADDLNIMVDDMLDVSKLEAGMLAVRRTPCAVADIVHHIHVGMERKAEVKGVSLEVAVGEDLPTVYCDFEKAGRIIVNLVVNAIKFCRDPGIVRLWAEEDPDAGEVIVGVTDNGPGIDDAKQAELFRRFKQLGNQERGSTKGFGLGLNIARELVDLNFGRMRVESELGKGSTFSFSLPVADPTSVMDRYLARIAHVENGGAMTSLIAVDVEGPLDPSVSDEIDDFLAHVLRKNDLVFRADEAGWLLVVPVEGHDLAAFLT